MEGEDGVKNRKYIKIKKIVKGLNDKKIRYRDGKVILSDIYVQITQDNSGTTISLNNFGIDLTELGYRLVKD